MAKLTSPERRLYKEHLAELQQKHKELEIAQAHLKEKMDTIQAILLDNCKSWSWRLLGFIEPRHVFFFWTLQLKRYEWIADLIGEKIQHLQEPLRQ